MECLIPHWDGLTACRVPLLQRKRRAFGTDRVQVPIRAVMLRLGLRLDTRGLVNISGSGESLVEVRPQPGSESGCMYPSPDQSPGQDLTLDPNQDHDVAAD